jgi:SAM-dependent methyltransferase
MAQQNEGMKTKSHWEAVYQTKSPDSVSWYAPHLDMSLAYIRRAGLPTTASIIDVGGGESTLVDDLLDANYEHVCVLDISARALAVCRERLGPRADKVDWLAADVLTHPFGEHVFDVWHDRAVFHFLTNEEDRQQYVRQVLRALRPGGYAIVGTFGPAGPAQCSGLPVSRYAPDELHGQFGRRFTLVESGFDRHTTPWGATQQFVYCFCRLDQ